VASRASKKKKKFGTLLRYRHEYSILKESEDDFKKRIAGMPVYLLLVEYKNICEEYGIESHKVKHEWTETVSKIHERLNFVQKEIMYTVHMMYDNMLMSDYYADQAYAKNEKENNVKVSKKSNK